MSRLFAVQLALVTALAACAGGGDSPAAEVRPIEDILTSEIVVTPDPTGTVARLDAETTRPVVCSVVYGTSEAFGLIATDDDMAGGAHEDHGPLLRGLSPETTYLYRLQGSDAAGNLYRSDILTFTTPAATQPDRPGDNVAPQATIVDVTSEFSPAFAAGNAIDGDPATEWSTAGDGDGAAITIDLGQVRDVVGIGFWSRGMTDGSAVVLEYTVTVDGGTPLGPFPAGDGALTVTDVAFEGRVLTVTAATTTGGNTGAVEIEVYAAP